MTERQQAADRGARPLSELSLEELWQLFPIQLTAHQPVWAAWYREEAASLAPILPDSALLHHIGSTALSGIWAKPIIDILVEVDPRDWDAVKPLFIQSGYLCMYQDETHMDFNKGYTPTGFAERVFHLHLRRYGDRDELYFLSYLNVHPEIAGDYEALKLSLWKPYEHDRDGYTNAKTDFVRRYTKEAKKMIQSRCGVPCDACERAAAVKCSGCLHMDKPFWGGECGVKSCCEGKGLAHCGECPLFPCDMAANMGREQGFDPAPRLENCRKWAAGNS